MKTLTVYLTKTELSRYKRRAKEGNISWAEHLRSCVRNARFIPAKAATQALVSASGSRKARVVNVHEEIYNTCKQEAKKNSMTMSDYVHWCLLNEEHIPRKRSKARPQTSYNRDVQKASKHHPALLALVSEMTLEELSERTGHTVKEIVDWAMGPHGGGEPVEVIVSAKEEAEEADAEVLEKHLQVVG